MISASFHDSTLVRSRYHKASDKVSYYNRVLDHTDSESDGLLSLDEVDGQSDRSNGVYSSRLVVVDSSAPEDAPEQHRLLSVT